MKNITYKSVALDTSKHNRKNFDCGIEELNVYLQFMANQQDKKDNARTFILEDKHDRSKIIGYYTLTMISLELSTLPKSLQNRHKFNNSAALIARLAVDKRYQNQGYGETLLIDALLRLLHASKVVAFPIIVVDAKESAKEFYKQYGFIEFNDISNRMFIAVKSVQKSFAL